MGIENNSIKMIYLLIIFGLIGTQYPVKAQIDSIIALASFGLTSYQTMDGIHDTILKFETASTDDIMVKLGDLSKTVDMWGNKIENKLEEMDTFLRRLPLLEGITDDVGVLSKDFTRIDRLYEEFKEYIADPDSFNDNTVKDLLDTFTSREGDDVVATINSLHGVIVPDQLSSYKKSVLLLLAQETKEFALEVCNLGVPQYRLLDFYSIVATIEIRALMLTSTGYLMRSIRENTSYMGEIKRTDNRFLARMESYLLLLQTAMEISSKQFRRCDPEEGYRRGKTFYEFDHFLQSIVANEESLDSGYSCWSYCETVPNPTRMYHCIEPDCTSRRTMCHGSMRHCKSLNNKAETCEIEGTGPRRFEWMRDGNGHLHPDDTSSCPTDIHYFERRAGLSVTFCDVCQCLCVEDSYTSRSTHFISLRKQLSDVANNKVIVGVQFLIINQIAHVEIVQGLLGPDGAIDEDVVEWVELENIQYDFMKSAESQSFKFYKLNEDGSQEELFEDKDVAVLTYDFRIIDLDKLTASPKQLITGIKFARDLDGSSAKPIHLEIQATPFDYKSGKLDIGKSVWIRPKDTDYFKNADIRTEYVGEGFRNPEKSKHTFIDTKPNTFMEIHWSDWDEDGSQTTLPLLDAHQLYGNPLIPLIGVGLYHKKQKGYGGFLTFVLEGFDRSPYVVAEIPKKKTNKAKSEGKEPKEDETKEEKPREEGKKPRQKGRRRS